MRKQRCARWRSVAPTKSDLIAFCRREGLPGEDPGPATFDSIAPEPEHCHTRGNLFWKPGTGQPPWSKSYPCRLKSCSYCAVWMGGERLEAAAEQLGKQLTPEYVGQIYMGANKSSICRNDPHIQLFAHWFNDRAKPEEVKDLLQDRADRLRKKGARVEYLAVMDHRRACWVLSTAPLWDHTPGRRGRPPKSGVVIVPVDADIGLAWIFGIMSSGAAMDWTRTRGFTPGSENDRSFGNIRLGWEENKVNELAGHMLSPLLDQTTSEAMAREMSSHAIADAKTMLHRGVECVSCGREVQDKTAWAWSPGLGFTCSDCHQSDVQAAAERYEREHIPGPPEEKLIADALRGLLVQGPATEGEIERWMKQERDWMIWFRNDGELLRQSLTLVGAVCHPDGRWGFSEQQTSVAG